MKIFTNVIANPVRAKQSIFGRLVFALVFACIFIACGDESGSSAPDPIGEISSSSNEDLGSSSSVGENGWENGSSSSLKPDSNGSQKNSSSATTVRSSSSSNAKSSSSKAWTCKEEGKSVTRYNEATGLIDVYLCTNGVYELVVYSSSSEKVYTFKELFKEDSVFNKNMEYGTFVDSRDGQEYKTIVIKTGYVSVPEFEAFAQNLNYGTQIKLETSVFDDNKVEKYCYDDDPWYCEHYFGGLYSWSEAMGLPKACDSVWTGTTQNCPDSIAPGIVYEAEWSDLQIQGICPEGWHVMNETEWRALIHGDESASRAISKASYGGNESGFSALRGGGKLVSHPELNAVYEDIGDACNYWLPSEESEGGANGLVDYRYSYFMYDRIHDKNFGLPVRCVKNYLSESR